jgi:hypothetical protein
MRRYITLVALLAFTAGVAVGGPGYAPAWEYDPDPEVEAVLQEAHRLADLCDKAQIEAAAASLPKALRLAQARDDRDGQRQRLADLLAAMSAAAK